MATIPVATISVAMATCNGARHLREQLDSIACQTLPPDELVIGDDASDDATIAIVAAFAATAPFAVRLLPGAVRLGYNANFARMIAACGGDLIFVADQDDRWFPAKIERVSAALLARADCWCATNDQRLVDAGGADLGGTVLGNVRALGYPDGFFGPGCCTALRREYLAVVAPFPRGIPYDHWLTIVAEILGARLLIEEPLQTYRRHDGNASASVFAAARPGWRALLADARDGDARAGFAARVVLLETIAARLSARRERIVAMGRGDRLPAALAALAQEAEDYRARSAVLGMRRVRRVAAITGLARRGTYRRFRGARTALKDLIG